jgi:hypothetical protein
LHGSENWTIKARGARIITAAEMIHMKKVSGYTWTDKKNTKFAKRINITPVLDKIQEYKRKCLQHINRMPRNRFPGNIKKLQKNRQEKPGKISRRVIPKRSNKGPNSVLAR